MSGARSLSELVEQWSADAETLEEHGATAQAKVCTKHAIQLDIALQQQGNELLTLAQASDLSGYSRDYLRRLVADGTIPDAGRRNAPRIRRKDCPKKAGSAGTPQLKVAR